MLIFGIPWAVFGSIIGLYTGLIAVTQILYYTLITLKIKLQLKLENNRLNYLRLKLSNRVLALNLNKILKKLNQIHSNIDESNKFWSKYLFSMCFGIGINCSIFIAQLLDNLDIYTLITFINLLFTTILCICLLLYSSVRVNNESNNSLKIINKLLFNSNTKSLAVIHRMKV